MVVEFGEVDDPYACFFEDIDELGIGEVCGEVGGIGFGAVVEDFGDVFDVVVAGEGGVAGDWGEGVVVGVCFDALEEIGDGFG